MDLLACMIYYYIYCTCRIVFYLHNQCVYILLTHFFLFLHFMHSCLLISERLSTRFDNELFINLRLPMNFSLSVIGLPSLFSFFIGTVNVMYFAVSSPKRVIPSILFTNSLMMKWKSYFDPLWNTAGISFCTLYFKLHVLCAAPLYLPA